MRIIKYSDNYIYKTASVTASEEFDLARLFPGKWSSQGQGGDGPLPDGAAEGQDYLEYRGAKGLDNSPTHAIRLTSGGGNYYITCEVPDAPDEVVEDGEQSDSKYIQQYLDNSVGKCFWVVDGSGKFPKYEEVLGKYKAHVGSNSQGAETHIGEPGDWKWGVWGKCEDGIECNDFFINKAWKHPNSSNSMEIAVSPSGPTRRLVKSDPKFIIDAEKLSQEGVTDHSALLNTFIPARKAAGAPTYAQIWNAKADSGWENAKDDPMPPQNVISQRVADLNVKEISLEVSSGSNPEPPPAEEVSEAPAAPVEPEEVPTAPVEDPSAALIEAGPQGGWKGYIKRYEGKGYKNPEEGRNVWEAWMKSYKAWGSTPDYEGWRTWYKGQHELKGESRWNHGDKGYSYSDIVTRVRDKGQKSPYMMRAGQAVSLMLDKLKLNSEVDDLGSKVDNYIFGSCIRDLIKLANHLDKNGLTMEANFIDKAISE